MAPLPPLTDWANFYVITGSAAAALTGLQFVVIALRNEAVATEGGEHAVRAFGTPNVLHFCGALLVSALLAVPGHSTRSLAWSVGATGAAGLVLSARVAVLARRQQAYTPVLEDWVGHVVLPLLSYATLTGAALALPGAPRLALDLVAAGSLLLLFTGIRNAWDSAVWIASSRR